MLAKGIAGVLLFALGGALLVFDLSTLIAMAVNSLNVFGRLLEFTVIGYISFFLLGCGFWFILQAEKREK